MRPDNFPPIRISQFAKLVYDSENLLSKLIDEKDLKKIEKLFNTTASEYWNDHYIFDKVSTKEGKKKLGKQSTNILFINTLVPTLYAYGKLRNEEEYKERALTFLENIAMEKNSITDNMQAIGFSNKNAFDSQSLLQLKREYCDHKKCLSCSIGVKILNRPRSITE